MNQEEQEDGDDYDDLFIVRSNNYFLEQPIISYEVLKTALTMTQCSKVIVNVFMMILNGV